MFHEFNEAEQASYDAKVATAYSRKDLTLEIAVKWCIEDVLSLDPDLTLEQASDVLEAVKRRHDAEIGVNWDVLQYWIDEVKSPAYH